MTFKLVYLKGSAEMGRDMHLSFETRLWDVVCVGSPYNGSSLSIEGLKEAGFLK